VDLESCVDGVRQDGGVLGHLSCIGTCCVMRQGVIRERFGFYGLVGANAFGAVIRGFCGNGAGVIGVIVGGGGWRKASVGGFVIGVFA